MSTIKVAINGFGRIGRLVYRQIYNMEGIDVVAVNDLTSPEQLAHLLKYDSAQGTFNQKVSHTENSIKVNEHELTVYKEKDPANIPWGKHEVDVVIESTGFFADKEKAEAHIRAGAKKVIISAPATGDIKTVVFNVNHQILDGSETIISCASCTTNCLAPMAKALNDAFGIKSGIMTTIHAYTNDQNTLDAPHPKGDLRRARAAAQNIGRLIPGVLGDESSALTDSFQDDLLAPPVYTRPENFRGWEVPKILLSGNHKAVEQWRDEEALKRTAQRRPGLLKD